MLGALHDRLVFRRRVRVLGQALADMLPVTGTVLDVGCGDGSIAAVIMSEKPRLKITGLEVQRRPSAQIPVTTFDGSSIPRDTGTVDSVLLVDVLHHTEDPKALLGEALRVARMSVVLKDHTKNGLLAGPTLRFMDWIGNAPHGVVLPYNYLTESEWRRSFRDLGVEPAVWWSNLDLYPWPANMLFERGLHFVAVLPATSFGDV